MGFQRNVQTQNGNGFAVFPFFFFFFFFFSLFDVWVCFNGLIGVMTMGMGLVWVSIFFDLLMSVEMGFQPWCLWRKWVCSDFLFFPLFDVWVYFNGLIGVMIVGMGLVWVSILFDLLMSAEMGFQPWCLWRKRVCKFFFFPLFDVWVCFNGLIGVMTMGMGLVWVSIFFDLLISAEMGFQSWWTCDGNGFAVFSFFPFVWFLGLLQWFDRSDDRGYGFSLYNALYNLWN